MDTKYYTVNVGEELKRISKKDMIYIDDLYNLLNSGCIELNLKNKTAKDFELQRSDRQYCCIVTTGMHMVCVKSEKLKDIEDFIMDGKKQADEKKRPMILLKVLDRGGNNETQKTIKTVI